MKHAANILLCFLLCCSAFGQTGTGVLAVAVERIGRTNIIHWQTLTNGGPFSLINLTNMFQPPRATNALVRYSGEGWIQHSPDGTNWRSHIVMWTNLFVWPATGTIGLFRAPAIPPLNPTNRTILLPQL